MPANRNLSGKARFVGFCQQAFALAVVGVVAMSAAGVVELRIVSPADPETTSATSAASASRAPGASAAGSLVSSAPVTPTVRTIPLGGGGLSGMTSGSHQSAKGDGTAQENQVVSPPEPTTGYATVGVTWRHGVRLSSDQITLEVRTRDHGSWSAWEEMHYDGEHGPDPGSAEARAQARPGTDAVVVGHVEDVQVKATTTDVPTPPDLALAIIDPGHNVAPTYEAPAIDTGELASAQVSDAAALAGSPATVTPKPKIFSRAQWGADERLRDPSSLHYGEVHAGFVHHTVNANYYTRAQVPSILRDIYAYHTQSRGWSDVGYNFLIDRFGQIWEGRYGGVDRPVVGAHTLGYNDDSFAASAIGNFEEVRPSEAMLEAYAELFAWKLSLHGVRADDTKQWVTSRYFQAINGHRDAGQTACPGRYLYERIPDIRRRAAQLQRSFRDRNRTADLSGRAWPDLVVRDKVTHHAMIVRTGGQTAFLKGIVAAHGWSGKDLLAAPGDLDGDGRGDLLARDRASRQTSLYPVTRAGGLAPATRTFDRFSNLDQLTGVGDFNGDGTNDVVGRDHSSHALLLFPGSGSGTFGRSHVLAADWRGYDRTVGVDDFDGDGRADIVAHAGNTLYLFPGKRTTLGARHALPGTFGSDDLVTGRGDASGDHRPDLVVRKAGSGLTYVYPGDGAGGLGLRIGGFSRYSEARLLVLAGQLVGRGKPELVGVNGDSGDLRVFPNSGRKNLGRTFDTHVVLNGINLLVNVGDWNGDGHGDFMARRQSGEMVFYAGLGKNRFSAPVRAAPDWSRVSLIAAVGDMTGDGYPDLMGRYAGGDFRIYPSNGGHGFRTSYVAHSAIEARSQAGIGLWDGDGAPDTLLRANDGSLWMWAGNGPGGLMNGKRVAGRAGGYDWVRGYGDVNGDKRADLVVRQPRTGKLYILPGGRSGFGDRRLIGGGFDAYDYAG